jgi:hypothetical protein
MLMGRKLNSWLSFRPINVGAGGYLPASEAT